MAAGCYVDGLRGQTNSVTASHDGSSVYMARYREIVQWDVGERGALTLKDTAVAAEDSAGGFAFSPDGDTLYVSNASSGVSQYSVGSGGRLARSLSSRRRRLEHVSMRPP